MNPDETYTSNNEIVSYDKFNLWTTYIINGPLYVGEDKLLFVSTTKNKNVKQIPIGSKFKVSKISKWGGLIPMTKNTPVKSFYFIQCKIISGKLNGKTVNFSKWPSNNQIIPAT